MSTEPDAPAEISPDRDGLAALDTSIPPWPGAVERHGGLPVHVRRSPGPDGVVPALFVHGLGGSASNWTDLSALLSPLMPGAALDLPGFGRSDPPPDGRYSLDAYADVVIAMLEATGPTHLFGNSMGGSVAMLVASRRPELVRTLTLVSPAVADLRPHPSRMSDPRLPLVFLPVIGPVVQRRLQAESPRERAEALVRLCFGEPERVPENRLTQAISEARERGAQAWASQALGRSFGAMVQTWLTLPGRSLWAAAGRITAPTLVVWGAQDRLVGVDRGPRLVSRLARGRLLVLNRVGHVAQMERPVDVARAFVAMTRSVEAGEW